MIDLLDIGRRRVFGLICFSRIFLLVASLLAGSSAIAAEKLVISTFEDSHTATIASAIMRAAYKKLRIHMELYETSGSRALMLSSQGRVDGELMRVFQVGETYPDLIRVRIPGFFIEGVVLVREENKDAFDLDDLAYLRVGYLAGVVQSQRFVENFKQVWVADTNAELFTMLLSGRLDAIVTNTSAWQLTTSLADLDRLAVLEPPYRIDQFYHYLHRKNEAIVPKLQAVLDEMHRSGEIDRINDRALKDVLEDIKAAHEIKQSGCVQVC